MTKAEMNRRLAGMTTNQIEQVKKMIHDGYGAYGISLEFPVTLKQANAVFEWMRRNPGNADYVQPVPIVRGAYRPS